MISRCFCSFFFLLSFLFPEGIRGQEANVVHKVEDPFWESGRFEFGPFKGMLMDVEFFRALRIVPAEELKSLYGIDLKSDQIAVANIRGRHVKADTLLGAASHYIALLPMDHVGKLDYVSTAITSTIRHSAFRFHFSRDVAVFPQIRPKNAKNYKVHAIRYVRELFFDTSPVDPKPDWTLSEAERLRKADIYRGGSSFVPSSMEEALKNVRQMKAITRMGYLPEEYKPSEARYVELDLQPGEPVRALTEWIRMAKNTKYIEPYHLFMANCYTDACGLLKGIFANRMKSGLIDSCRYYLSSLPLGASNELTHLTTLGLIKPDAKWTPLLLNHKP